MKRSACTIVLLFIVLATSFSQPAGAAAAGQDLFLVSLGRGQGANGSFWYATVWIHNPSPATAAVTVSLLERGVANPAPIHTTIMVDPGQTITLDDALSELFGSDRAFGALRLTADQDIVAAARSYNLTAAGLADSQGQFMAAMPAELAISAGETTSIPGITQPADGSFRCNFAVVETTGAPVGVTARLLDPDGALLATGQFDLGDFEARQVNIALLDGTTSVAGGRLEISVKSGAGRVLALASMVGNGTESQDPSTLEMEYTISSSSPTGDGDITAVFADEGLTGGGVTGDVTIGISDGGVTTSKIAGRAVGISKLSASGSDSGQILTSTGTTVAWQDPPSGSGDGDITAVNAGAGLSGGGTTGDVTLSIADSGVTSAKIANNAITNNKIVDGQVLTADLGNSVVTKAKLSAGGGSAGQVLGTNGSTLVWQTPPSFTLPYSGTTSTSGDVMYLRNSGSGRAIQAVSGSDTALWAQSTSGIGIDARSSSGIGLVVSSTSNDGIQAVSGGTGKSAVYGEHSNAYGAAVYGRNTYANHFGCIGCENIAVWGENGISGTVGILGAQSAAVYAIEGGAGSAGIFDGPVSVYGNLDIQGTVTKSGGSFKIDHPLDPDNQYLSHSFVESPDMMNVYNGNAVTDKTGFATIDLPEWFGVLNRDFRYQLTVIGNSDTWAQARIAEEIAENSFVIQTSEPNTRVSWQVTGIRHDPWAEAHRIPVEEVKPDAERGLYLHPELYDQPAEKSLKHPPAGLPLTGSADN